MSLVTEQHHAVAFLGLGVMGGPMAGHLSAAGHRLKVWNRSRRNVDLWGQSRRGEVAETPAAAAAGAEFVFMCLGNDDSVRAVVYGPNGVLAGLAPGAVLIDHTTASATLARELDAATKAQGSRFLDAPVSGGQTGAEQGILTIMVGGDPETFAKVGPVLHAYGRKVRLMGPAGAGQLTKMVNQTCIAGLLQGLAEGLAFAERAGLDPQLVVEVIAKGAAQSWQMDHRAPTMIADRFDFGFAVDWMRKDLAIVLEEARHNGARLPVTALVDQFFAEIQALGGGRWDTSSLIRLLRLR